MIILIFLIPLSLIVILVTVFILWLLSLKVQNTTNNGGEIAAKVLKSHNVKFIFTLIGGHIAPILVESEKLGIKIIDVRQECTSVFAADAMARLSGEPGIAIVTAGPGITNTVTALKNAQMAQSPLILIGGCAPSLLKHRGSLQDIDQMSLVKSLVKFKTSCSSVRQINDKLKECFFQAQSGVPGPVFIEIPVDLLWPIQEIQCGMGLIQRKFKKQITAKTQSIQDELKTMIIPSNIKKSKQEYFDELDDNSFVYQKPSRKVPFILYNYMTIQLKYMFGNAWTTKYNSYPKTVDPLIPSSSRVNQVYAMLAKAKKPVFLLGSQTMVNAKLVPQIAQGLEQLGVPIFCGGMARGLNSKANKFSRGQVLKEADLVILFGIPVDFRLNYGKTFNRKSTIVTINRSKHDMTMNSDIFWKPSLKIQCDPGQFIVKLCSKSSLATQLQIWNEDISKKQVDGLNDVYSKADTKVFGNNDLKGQELVNPVKLFQVMNKVFASDKSKKTIYIGDGGDFIATAAQSLTLNHSLSWLDPGAFGTLGCGAGFALASKLYCPDAEVVIVWGDGSTGYGIVEYDTFQRHNLNIKSVIGNDACWKQVERDQATVFKSTVACQLDYSNYQDIAKVFKGDGAIIRKNEDLEQVLMQAKQSKKPFVVNVLIGDLNFREGALSV